MPKSVCYTLPEEVLSNGEKVARGSTYIALSRLVRLSEHKGLLPKLLTAALSKEGAGNFSPDEQRLLFRENLILEGQGEELVLLPDIATVIRAALKRDDELGVFSLANPGTPETQSWYEAELALTS